MAIRSLILLILLVTCIPLPAHTDSLLSQAGKLSKIVDHVTAVTGTCSIAIINGVDRTRECNRGFTVIVYKTGRVAYIFFIGMTPPVQTIAFGGSKEGQLAAAQFAIVVDSIDIYPKRIASSGSCEMEGNSKVAAIYTCEAHSLESDSPYHAKIVFKSDSAPRNFPTPKQ